MEAIPAPHDEADASLSGAAKRYRRTRLGFQRWRPARRLLAAVARPHLPLRSPVTLPPGCDKLWHPSDDAVRDSLVEERSKLGV
jgi:hypothetical protein